MAVGSDGYGNDIRDFLRDELAMSPSTIDIVLGQCRVGPDALPTVLWRYGLVTIDQFASLFIWLKNRPDFPRNNPTEPYAFSNVRLG